MHEFVLVALFMGGLLGSAHCVAMCGGIATAMGTNPADDWWRGVLYQLGRISSYALAGAIAGGFGRILGRGISHTHWVEYLRLATAILIVLIGLDLAMGGLMRARWLRGPERLGAIFWRRFAPTVRQRMPQQPDLRAYALGLLWGWLPCGLVYSALTTAVVSGGSFAGATTMMAFGLGTLPAMYGVGRLGTMLPRRGSATARLAGSLIVAGGLWTAFIPLQSLAGAGQASYLHSFLPAFLCGG